MKQLDRFLSKQIIANVGTRLFILLVGMILGYFLAFGQVIFGGITLTGFIISLGILSFASFLLLYFYT